MSLEVWLTFYCFSSLPDPSHERAQQNVIYFGDELKKYKITGEKGESGVRLDLGVKPVYERDSLHRTSAFQSYEKLCRGEVRNFVSYYPLQVLMPNWLCVINCCYYFGKYEMCTCLILQTWREGLGRTWKLVHNCDAKPGSTKAYSNTK